MFNVNDCDQDILKDGLLFSLADSTAHHSGVPAIELSNNEK